MPEILSPAGSREKMEAAIRYGADAVYLAYKSFGMRSAADNFSLDELKDAVIYAHERTKRVYMTVNSIVDEDGYSSLCELCESIKEFGIDAFIVSDLGVASVLREYMPDCCLHLSTQCSVSSSRACMEYAKLGFSRIVLARELSLEQIKQIRQNTPRDIELEVFVHGSMCIAYSGRCLLSQYYTGRNANKGQCTQPCRWVYNGCVIREEKRPDMPLDVIEDPLGTYVMASKDLCMIEHIPQLCEAGISCFKIEGRMKSAYYTSVVTNTYRMALDSYLSNKDGYSFDPAWQYELDSVSHREYDTGFFFTSPKDDPKIAYDNGYIREKAYLATAVGYDKSTGRALFYQKNKVSSSQSVELLSPGHCGVGFIAEDMRDESGAVIESAPHPKMLFSLRVPFEVKVGDILRGGSV